MKRILSLSTLWQSIKVVILRFPIQFAITIFAVGICWMAIDAENSRQTSHFYTLLAIIYITFSFTLAGDLFIERKGLSILKAWAIRILILIFCAILYFILSPQWLESDLYRIVLLIIAGHLLVSFSPGYPLTQINAFWQYNKTLFLRFLTAVLYSAVLYLGLTIALLSIDALFNQNISGDIYFKLFALIAAGFNTIFFLAGIPTDLQTVDQQTDYPKGLKIFTQYVLIPLLTIYLGILVIYEIKIVLDRELPDGMVSILILGYAIFGILSILLIYPIKNNAGNEWMKTFSRSFFLLMIPLLVLLFIAIWVRIANYAITEPRFFLVMIALWLSIMVFYFIIAKSPNIQIIPITLCLLALASTFGPQSAASVSKRSQLSRFKAIENDTDRKNASEKVKGDNEKASIITYLVRSHGLSSLQPLTEVNLGSIQKALKAKSNKKDAYLYSIKEELLDTAFTLLKVASVSNHNRFEPVNIEIEKNIINIASYNYSIDFQSYSTVEEKNTPLGAIKIEALNDNNMIKVKIGEQDSIIIDLIPLNRLQIEAIDSAQISPFSNRRNSYLLPQNKLSLSASTPNLQLSFVFKSMTLSGIDTLANNRYNQYSGILLIKKNLKPMSKANNEQE